MAMTFIRKLLNYLTSWRIYIGCPPGQVSPRAIIFFPLYRATFCCGLSGILTIKGKKNPDGASPDEVLQRCFETIRRNDLLTILSGAMPVSSFLDGSQCLTEMNQALHDLKGNEACRQVLCQPDKARFLQNFLDELKQFFSSEEQCYEDNAAAFSTADAEIINSRMTLMKDIIWGLEKDVLKNMGKISALAGDMPLPDFTDAAFRHYNSLNFILNALDRLEVRGRDSAGIQVSFTLAGGSALDEITASLKVKGLYDDFTKRSTLGDLSNGTITVSMGDGEKSPVTVAFTYKTFSIIGELGKNIAALRKDVGRDAILHEFAGRDMLFDTALAHTRWASVGSITEENCHPINNFSLTATDGHKDYPHYGPGTWGINVVLNGDIDNYQELRKSLEGDRDLIASAITTDTKIIPLVIEKYLNLGNDLAESFRLAVGDFEGSHAIAMASDTEPGKVYLALKGSGQAVYVGLSGDAYLFSSELYGLIERTSFFVKMDGEKPSRPDAPEQNGQIFILDQAASGDVSEINALFYDGTPISLTRNDLQKAEMTTRDIDRRAYPHFFLKEISESPRSVRKTLQGKYRFTENGRTVFNFGDDILPPRIREAILSGGIRHIVIIGHGTAAVAGAAIADGWKRYLKETTISVEAKIASELSGFSLQEDLSDTLVIPITQSGTTTDTNRAVTMARERGAFVIAIVNRRQSDITAKSHGVFYTSDGRDIEMSVASTKAFYSQIVAGHLLGLCFAQLLRSLPDHTIVDELRNLEDAPSAMERVMGHKETIRQSVDLLARGKKYWAIVGSGPNKAAADEIRIKLSELCYKTISSDVVENKKHIDLSAEPLIIVCAAGNPETVVGDIVKDVAIFRAHKAGIVVFADEGEDRFNGIADSVIAIPNAPQPLSVILNTVAGHLWGYYAAQSIDNDSRFFREFRSRLNLTLSDQGKRSVSFYERIADRQFRHMVQDFTASLNERRRADGFAGATANTISDMVLLLKYAVGKIPMEDFWQDFPDEEGLFTPLDRLDICLGQVIDELSRPIDAIRHQAKTVTVGTSRKERLLTGIIFDLIEEMRFSPKHLTSKNVLAITKMQTAIGAITGYTLYDVNNLDADGNPTDDSTIAIAKRSGISMSMTSRTEQSRTLMGTKRTLVSMGHVYVGLGKLDGAPIVIIPILGEHQHVRSLLLIHVHFNEALSVREKIDVLGYKFNDIRNIINEYNLPWDDRYIEALSVGKLMSETAEVIAGQIRQSLQKTEGPEE
ncbi:MAG: glutamine---fructose-6-phosphate transaminase (isomerizing) [Syntrophus sp. SKADARSKE-3]|nr:glutamine---fructose-6-phosphate transaminase (isomerizing) [Syntrophus sp. SKADARSKE-3]